MNKMAGHLLAIGLRRVREIARVKISRTRKVPLELESIIDAVVQMAFPSGDVVTVCIDVKRTLRPAHLPEIEYIRERCRALLPESKLLLIASIISESLAQELSNRRIWFVDTLGNIHLDLGSQLLLSVTGRRPKQTTVLPRGNRLSAQAACVLFQFLRHGPDVEASYRDVAEATGVSLGMISKLVVAWRERALIRRAGRGAYRILKPAEMLRLWCNAYADTLSSRLLIRRCRSLRDDDMRLLIESLRADPPVTIGGELAADMLNGHLRASGVHLYIREEDENRLRRELRLAPSESGPVELHRTFSTDLAKTGVIGDHLPIAHPVLVYAELMAGEVDRIGEAAVRLRQEYLAWTL